MDAYVREACSSDFEKVLDLYFEFYRELRVKQGLNPGSREDYRSDFEKIFSRDKLFLAETSGGDVVGFIRVSERDGCYGFEELYVKPMYRGRGVGKLLVREAENYVKRNDPYVYIMVLPQDRNALGFWIHMGYSVLNSIELSKNLSGGVEDIRSLLLLSNILKIYRWDSEEYTYLEKRFLELVEEFVKRNYSGEELLEIIVKALEDFLNNSNKHSLR